MPKVRPPYPPEFHGHAGRRKSFYAEQNTLCNVLDRFPLAPLHKRFDLDASSPATRRSSCSPLQPNAAVEVGARADRTLPP